MDNIKKVLFSMQGMIVINLLFLAALLIPSAAIIVLAYAVWIFYLFNGVKNAPSEMVKTVDSICIGFAALMIIINLYIVIKGLF